MNLYEIVKYNAELKSQVVELQKHLWGLDTDLNTACLEWKYNHNPYIHTPLIYLSLFEGKVVGMRGMFGAKWQMGSPRQELVVPCVADSVIAPDHRKKGLLGAITSAALEDLNDNGYTYVFGLSASPVTYIKNMTMGWRSIGPCQEMIWKAGQKTQGKKSFVSKAFHGLGNYFSKLPVHASTPNASPFRSLDKNSKKSWDKINSHVSAERTSRPAEMAELIRRIGNDGRLQHVRDREYFVWRFQNPRSVYRFLFWQDTRLDGYLILRSSVYRDKPGVSIVDCEATSDQVFAELLHAAIHWGEFSNLRIWSTSLSKGIMSVLQDSGFKLSGEPKNITRYRPSVLVRAVPPEMMNCDWVLANRQLLDLNNWDLRLIDSDGN